MYHVDHAAIVFLLTDGLLFLLQLSSLICTKHIENSSAVLSGPIPIVADFLLLKGNAKILKKNVRVGNFRIRSDALESWPDLEINLLLKITRQSM